MMSRKKEMALIAAGMLTGALLAPTAHAAVRQLTATPNTQKFYVDGKQTHLEAYSINSGNYVKLRDIGKAVRFNLSYDGYTNNVFADGPVGPLPTPTCDWSAFPEVEVPKVEIRHFAHDDGDSMFIRNIYETRRMQYTIYNAIGREPSVWRDGKPLMTIALTIDPADEPWVKTSWPWRASDLEDLVHSRPNSHFYVEAWDYYSKGIFQYTRYCVDSL